MIFKKPPPDEIVEKEPELLMAEDILILSPESFESTYSGPDAKFIDIEQLTNELPKAQAVVSIHQSFEVLDSVNEKVLQTRSQRDDGFPCLIIVCGYSQLTELGEWLVRHSKEETLDGVRIILSNETPDISQQIQNKLGPIKEKTIIKMPKSTEVDQEQVEYSYFYLSLIHI